MTDYERLKREYDFSQIGKNTQAIADWQAQQSDPWQGRNLIAQSDFSCCTDQADDNGEMVVDHPQAMVTVTSRALEQMQIYNLDLTPDALSRMRGQWLTMSVEYRVLSPITYGSVNPYLNFEMGLTRPSGQGKSQYLSPGTPKGIATQAGDWVKISRSAYITEHPISKYYFQMVARDFTGKVAFRHLKLEIGRQSTAWALAPEDGNVAQIRLAAYPIGSLYLALDNADPSRRFGGTWQRITDTFLLAAGSTYAAGSRGGQAKVSLTGEQMPAHTHNLYITGTAGDAGAEDYLYASGMSIKQPTSGRNTVATRASGGGEAHENMPPYLAVYVWQRIA